MSRDRKDGAHHHRSDMVVRRVGDVAVGRLLPAARARRSAAADDRKRVDRHCADSDSDNHFRFGRRRRQRRVRLRSAVAVGAHGAELLPGGHLRHVLHDVVPTFTVCGGQRRPAVPTTHTQGELFEIRLDRQ